MKQLLIDPAGGIAGDMFMAALISAGADAKSIKKAIQSAAAKLGSAEAATVKSADGSTQLKIKLHSRSDHLSEKEARTFLNELFIEFCITKKYSQFGEKILQILLHAEKKAHTELNIVVRKNPGKLRLYHPPDHREEIFLHEAQDIIIDIIGTVTGMQSLGIEPEATLLNPVSVGGGSVHFSHGKFPIPAPATKIILTQHHIDWNRGPIDRELCTPTGASILAALESRYDPECKKLDLMTCPFGKARGNRNYEVPPLAIYLIPKN